MSPDRRSGPNVTPVTVAEAGRHLDKAREYLRAAQTALAPGDLDAAAASSGRARQAPHAATTA